MKDNFSDKSDLYKQFRPAYPNELLKFLISKVSNFDSAWDCETGNGQIAKVISDRFKEVFATDISEPQLINAEKKYNLFYSKQPAEQTNFPANTFDLITVGQAVHWFNFDKFYSEVNRTLKNTGILAILGYGKLEIDSETDRVIDKLYFDILGEYWDKERKYVDENYVTIPFPFDEIKCPRFSNKYYWTPVQLFGYFETWSSVKHFINKNNKNPIDIIRTELLKTWNENISKEINFPILTRVGQAKQKNQRDNKKGIHQQE